MVSCTSELRQSEIAYDWLGHGIYFWEDSPARALRWAKEASHRQGRVSIPAVVGAVIDLGHCLNLTDAAALSLVRAADATYCDVCHTSGKPEARNRGRDLRARFLDCAVFETLHRLRENEGAQAFDTVRAFFVEGTEIYPGAGIRDRDHIQICVRNPKQIIGYFLPRNG